MSAQLRQLQGDQRCGVVLALFSSETFDLKELFSIRSLPRPNCISESVDTGTFYDMVTGLSPAGSPGDL